MANIFNKIAQSVRLKVKSSKHPSTEACASQLKQHSCGVPEISMSNIKFLKQLGVGAFGKVYKGELQAETSDGPSVLVYVKTLQKSAPEKICIDFLKEIEILADLHHPNIVCLLGVVTEAEPICVLFEHMSQGDLRHFLMRHSPGSAQSRCDSGLLKGILEQADLLIIATQIAAGMEYLACHGYKYLDLMSSNCLVGENLLVKLSQSGIIQERVCADTEMLLPNQWMSPEMLLKGQLTIESNVWNFGVLLWEIFSYGRQPYAGHTITEVVDMIQSHHLLQCPNDCPSHIYALMVRCWHETPVERPTFRDIYEQLKSWQNSGNKEELEDLN